MFSLQLAIVSFYFLSSIAIELFPLFAFEFTAFAGTLKAQNGNYLAEQEIARAHFKKLVAGTPCEVVGPFASFLIESLTIPSAPHCRAHYVLRIFGSYRSNSWR